MRHWHVGAVDLMGCKGWVWGTMGQWNQTFTIHELLHGKLVGFLRPPPLGTTVLEPDLHAQSGRGNI